MKPASVPGCGRDRAVASMALSLARRKGDGAIRPFNLAGSGSERRRRAERHSAFSPDYHLVKFGQRVRR